MKSPDQRARGCIFGDACGGIERRYATQGHHAAGRAVGCRGGDDADAKGKWTRGAEGRGGGAAAGPGGPDRRCGGPKPSLWLYPSLPCPCQRPIEGAVAAFGGHQRDVHVGDVHVGEATQRTRLGRRSL